MATPGTDLDYLKKPVNFGFLDFSTLEQRRADCEAEVRLNRRVCADLYLGVVDVVECDGRLAWGGPGVAVEPAVLMRRLPDTGMLPALLEAGTADAHVLKRVARRQAPQAFWSALGSAYAGHYSYPGGLAMHEWTNASLAQQFVVSYEAQTIADTGAHHPLGGVEAIVRGLPADSVVARLGAHDQPQMGTSLQRLINYVRASAIIARVDPVATGWLRSTVSCRWEASTR